MFLRKYFVTNFTFNESAWMNSDNFSVIQGNHIYIKD